MTIFGWDMSHFDAPGIGSAIDEGIAFLTHKAGGDKDDAELAAWWSGVRGLDPARVLLGAYWVLYPGNPTGRASLFIDRLDAACPGWRDRPFLLQVDCEKWNGDAGTVPSKADITVFCTALTMLAPKLHPVVYAPKWVYGNSLTGLNYPLWASAYVLGTGGFKSLYPGDGSSRWAAYSGQTPAILQFTSSASIGGQTTCDANAFRGTFDDLVALAAPGWSPDMAMTKADAQLFITEVRNTKEFLSDTEVGIIAAAAAAKLAPQITALSTAITALPTVFGEAEVATIVSGVLAGLTPEMLAAIPADLAQQVVDAFSARLAT